LEKAVSDSVNSSVDKNKKDLTTEDERKEEPPVSVKLG